MENEIMLVLVTAAITGALSTVGTVIALRVHIGYLRDHIDKIEANLTRVHTRIDNLIVANARPLEE
jgi:hypothetical protein